MPTELVSSANGFVTELHDEATNTYNIRYDNGIMIEWGKFLSITASTAVGSMFKGDSGVNSFLYTSRS